jgi:hypothetical protein
VGDEADVIDDFGRGDSIDLSAVYDGTLTYVRLAPLTAEGQVRVDLDTNRLQISLDGDGIVDMEIAFTFFEGLQRADFIL